MNPQEEINRIKSIMGLLIEGDDDMFDSLDWIRDIKPVPVTSLGPGAKFKIVELGPKAIKELNQNEGTRKYLKNGKIFKKKFIIDEEDGFMGNESDGVQRSTDYADANTTDFWLIDLKRKLGNTWIDVSGVMVVEIN
jgi:hypothetical protein